MPDILLDLPIKALPGRVFETVSTPDGLDRWWTLRSTGEAEVGREYRLYLGPEHDWRARVTRCVVASEFELELIRADDAGTGTRIGFELEPRDASTWVRFRHRGAAHGPRRPALDEQRLDGVFGLAEVEGIGQRHRQSPCQDSGFRGARRGASPAREARPGG